MKPLIVPFLIALMASIGIATGAKIMTTKRPAPEHAVVSDSAKKAGVPHDSGLKVIDASGSADSAPVASDSASTKVATIASGAAAAHGAVAVTQQGKADGAKPAPSTPPEHARSAPSAPAVAAPSVVTAPASATTPGSEKRVSRVFASMPPRDAAKILEQMSDPDVTIILGNLADKQAAAILAQLPAPRVAALSRGALRPTQGTK